MYTVTLRLRGRTTGEPNVIEAKFTNGQKSRLQDFVIEAQKLLATHYVARGPQASLGLKWTEESGVEITPVLPSQEVVDSFLYRMRPFVLQNEPTFFPSVRSTLYKKLDDELFRYLLARQHELWSGKEVREKILVSDNFGILNDDRTLMHWLNAYEYHRDKDKQRRLDPARQFLTNDGIRAFYLILMTEKVKAIGLLLKVADLVLGNRQDLEVRLGT